VYKKAYSNQNELLYYYKLQSNYNFPNSLAYSNYIKSSVNQNESNINNNHIKMNNNPKILNSYRGFQNIYGNSNFLNSYIIKPNQNENLKQINNRMSMNNPNVKNYISLINHNNSFSKNFENQSNIQKTRKVLNQYNINLDEDSSVNNFDKNKRAENKFQRIFNKYYNLNTENENPKPLKKIVDFVPRNFIKNSKTYSNENDSKITIQAASNNQSTENNNSSMSSSILSIGTNNTSFISNQNSLRLEDEEFLNSNSKKNNNFVNMNIDYRQNNNNFCQSENYNYNKNFCKNFPKNIYNNNKHSNLGFPINNYYLSNDLTNNYQSLNFPVIVSPLTFNININLNPQIYGNILIGNNPDFRHYYTGDNNHHTSEEENIQEQDNFINDNNIFQTNSVCNISSSNIKANNSIRNNTNNESNKYITNPLTHKLDNSSMSNNKNKDTDKNFLYSKNHNTDPERRIYSHKNEELVTFPIAFNKRNFCNWHSFMTNTTPLIYKNDDILLKSYFESFENISIFGVDCTFKSNNRYVKKTFSPTLSAINIEITSKNNNENTNTLSNLNSTLDGSFVSHVSENENSSKTKNSIFFYEDMAMHLRPLFCDKVNEFLKDNDLENLSLSDISENSWFAILWTAEKNKNNNNPEIDANFIVFYKLKNNFLNNKIGYIPVIGTYSGDFTDEIFWFSNQTKFHCLNNFGNLQIMQDDYYTNRFSFSQLKVFKHINK